jgi:hypothetical protein
MVLYGCNSGGKLQKKESVAALRRYTPKKLNPSYNSCQRIYAVLIMFRLSNAWNFRIVACQMLNFFG